MEENQARKPLQSYPTSHNLAHQPYLSSDDLPDDMPLDEENVVPIKPRLESVAEDQLAPRSSPKRKQGSAKSRSTSSKQKSAQSFRTPAIGKQSPFAEELQHLEELADRINHVLAERAQQRARMERSRPPTARGIDAAYQQQYPQSQQNQQQYPQPYQQPQAQPVPPAEPPLALEAEDTETLKRQAHRIRQRLTELEAMMEPPSPADQQVIYNDRVDHHPVQPPATPNYAQPTHQPYRQPPTPPPASVNPRRQRADYEAWQAREELQQLMQGQPVQPEPVRDRRSAESSSRQSSWLRRLRMWQLMELPAKPVDRLGNAAVWIAASVMFRVGSRYLLSAFPVLSPMFTLLMLAPAVLAVFLAVFVPKTGWIPFYRLFLIMLGLFIGGKF